MLPKESFTVGSAHVRYWSSGCITSMVTSTRSPTLTGTDELPEGETGDLDRSISDVTVLMPSADVPSSDGEDPQAKAAKVSARSPTGSDPPHNVNHRALFIVASARSQRLMMVRDATSVWSGGALAEYRGLLVDVEKRARE